MRRWITCLLSGLLLLAVMPAAAAQENIEPTDLPGLERAVARFWLGPMTVTETTISTTYNAQGTPITEERTVSTPAATPNPAEISGTVLLAVTVMEFDTSDHARAALHMYDQDQQETFRRDPRLPEMHDLPVEGIGDRAVAWTGQHTENDVTADWLFAAIQDGPFLYAITGQFAGLDVAEQARSIGSALVNADAEPGLGEFHRDGASSGGLWAKVAGLDPVLVEGSTITDSVIYPPSAATGPAASPVNEAPRVDLDHPATIAGLTSLYHRSYRPPHGLATPDASVKGVFRIDAWLLTFDSPEAASDAMTPLLNTLDTGMSVTSGCGSSGPVAPGERPSTETAGSAGFIGDTSLPPGKGVAWAARIGATVYAGVVYAVDDGPEPVAQAVMSTMTGASGSGFARFPDAGDPVLEGLVPVRESHPVTRIVAGATPEATPLSRAGGATLQGCWQKLRD